MGPTLPIKLGAGSMAESVWRKTGKPLPEPVHALAMIDTGVKYRSKNFLWGVPLLAPRFQKLLLGWRVLPRASKNFGKALFGSKCAI